MALLFVLLGGCASARMDLNAGSHAPEGLYLEVIEFHETLTDAAWVWPLSMICGFDLRPVWLVPGERVAVNATVFSGNRLRKLRVGVASSDGEYVVWSPMIDIASRRWGPSRR